ncbi:YeeE/YedE family protein [Thalassospira marina]|uniref:YeeE/YedE family protein n=1 Tax=Thalassospira marina TaxID=2048283 RepID=A0ABN5FKK7_9PROT|nr:YeeE/YedE family protein [Thalassospira marina]AUG54812.1 YeeE/YedE family protein [Thalassospira marina]
MENFTPFTSLAGGALIGLSAGLYIVLNGRIAGISGVIGGLINGTAKQKAERLAFIAGLVIGPVILALVSGYRPPITVDANLPVLVLAGLLVGYGTNLGSGCTSGHGICGLARFSPRSLAATLAFMGTGLLTTFVMRHLIGF